MSRPPSIDPASFEDASDSDVSTYIPDPRNPGVDPKVYLTQPVQPPPANPETKEAIEARITELENIEKENAYRYELLSSKRQRKDYKNSQRRANEDHRIQTARANKDERVWLRRAPQDNAFAQVDRAIDAEEFALRHKLKRLKKGRPLDEVMGGTYSSASPAKRQPDPPGHMTSYSLHQPSEPPLPGSRGPPPLAQSQPQYPSPSSTPQESAHTSPRSSSSLAPTNPPALPLSNIPVQSNAKPKSDSMKISQPLLQGLDNAFHHSPTNPPGRVASAAGRRTPSTNPDRHYKCERVDALNRGIWTSYGPGGTVDNPTGPKVEMYLRCNYRDCLRIDWTTAHGLLCHIVKIHKQPNGTISGLEKALEKYGVPVWKVEEYERQHGLGSGGTMSHTNSTGHWDVGFATWLSCLTGKKSIWVRNNLTATNQVVWDNFDIGDDHRRFGEPWARIDMYPGYTIVFPPGTIHAVWTDEDSIFCGGHFLVPQVMDRFVDVLRQIELEPSRTNDVKGVELFRLHVEYGLYRRTAARNSSP